MRAWNKADQLALVSGFLLLATASPANVQQEGVSEYTEKVVSMNSFSSDRGYIVHLSWQSNSIDDNIFDIFIYDSPTSARHDVEYDIALHRFRSSA